MINYTTFINDFISRLSDHREDLSVIVNRYLRIDKDSIGRGIKFEDRFHDFLEEKIYGNGCVRLHQKKWVDEKIDDFEFSLKNATIDSEFWTLRLPFRISDQKGYRFFGESENYIKTFCREYTLKDYYPKYHWIIFFVINKFYDSAMVHFIKCPRDIIKVSTYRSNVCKNSKSYGYRGLFYIEKQDINRLIKRSPYKFEFSTSLLNENVSKRISELLKGKNE